MSNDLTTQKCVPCEGGIPPLTLSQYQPYLSQVDGWEIVDNKQLTREFKFENFASALEFVNQIGKLTEQENHHPDIFLHNWNKVTVTLSTHAIHGLSTNDFILAAKISIIM